MTFTRTVLKMNAIMIMMNMMMSTTTDTESLKLQGSDILM